MIVNWKKHCEKIDETHELDRNDPSDNKSYFKQEIAYIRYLLDRGESESECFSKWRLIKNGVASQFAMDPEQLKAQFAKTYSRAKRKTYSFVEESSKIKPVELFPSEITKINSLQSEKWVKEYVLTLLVYYKFMSQLHDKVEYSTTLVNWALRQVCFSKKYKFRSYRDARATITNTVRKANFSVIRFTPIRKKEHYTTYSMNFAVKEGPNPVMTINSLDELSSAFALLRDDYRICKECGARFEIHSRTKTFLCYDCYKKYRRAYKTAKDREYYHRDKEKES